MPVITTAEFFNPQYTFTTQFKNTPFITLPSHIPKELLYAFVSITFYTSIFSHHLNLVTTAILVKRYSCPCTHYEAIYGKQRFISTCS